MTPQTTPTRLDLKKDQSLTIDWQDGRRGVYSLTLLRSMCPCAQCRVVREGSDPHDISPGPKKKPLLTILPGNYAGNITVVNASLVGNYALKIEWSDGHDSGIYSFSTSARYARLNGRVEPHRHREHRGNHGENVSPLCLSLCPLCLCGSTSF